MDYQQLIADMSPQIYARVKRAVEVGKWPDGAVMTAAQKENAMRALIAWGELHLDAADRVGFIDRGHKAGDSSDDRETQALNWKDEESPGG